AGRRPAARSEGRGRSHGACPSPSPLRSLPTASLARGRPLRTARVPDGGGLPLIHEQLPAPRRRLAIAVEAVGPPAAELGLAQPPYAAEHRGDAPVGPPERVLDRGK